MSKHKILAAMFLSASVLKALPVESEMDKPLNLAERWSFYRDDRVYIQHQCSARRAQEIGNLTDQFFLRAAETLGNREPVLPLQLRIFATVAQYRRTLRFSQYREAHYNTRLRMVTGYCGIAKGVLQEQLALFWLADANLRPWQRYLLAEALALPEHRARLRLTAGSVGIKPAPLAQVLLGGQIPDESERKALAELLQKISATGKLKEFLTGIYDNRTDDDTGLDVLEELFPGAAADILANREPQSIRQPSP